MARRVIANAAGAVATAHAPTGELLGVIEEDTTPPALTRPVVAPAAALANGSLPVTVIYPAGATGVVLWVPTRGISLPMANGVNFLRQGDLGYDTTIDAICALFEARGAGGATSNWIPRLLVWAEAIELPPVDELVTLVSGGTMTTSAQVGGAITLGPNAVWAGSVQQTDSWIETSPNGAAPWTNAGDLTAVPNSVGTYFRAIWAAYGPGASGNSQWHTTASAARQIVAAEVDPIAAGDVTFHASFFRPNTQTVDFAPEFTVSGAQALMQWTTVDPPTEASWADVIAGPNGGARKSTSNVAAGNFTAAGTAKRGNLRLRHRPNTGVPWSDPSPKLTVPVAVNPTNALYALLQPSDAAIRSALQANLIPYAINKPTNSGGGNAGINDRKWDPIIWVMASLAGVNTTFNGIGAGRNPRAYAIAQFQSWCSDAGTTAPPMRSGYHGQHEMRAVAFFAMCRLDPNIWNAAGITDTMRNRARWLMKLAGVANVWIASSLHTTYYGGGFGSATGPRSLVGWTAGNNNVPNFSSPPRLTPHLVNAFMARDTGNPTAFADFLADYDRETFFAEGEALGGMTEARRIVSRRWLAADQLTVYGTASTLGAGPTDAQVEAACHAAPVRLVGTGGNYTLAQPRQAMASELERVFSLPVRPGLLNARKGAGAILGSNTSVAPYNNPAQKYGITMDAQTEGRLRACHGVPTVDRGAQAGANGNTGTGVTIYEDIWLNLPDKGEIGMYLEFDTTDGGEAGGPNRRSAPTYGASGLGAIMDALVVMIYYGIIEPDDALFDTAKARWRVGIRHFNYAAKHGYLGYAKGGFDSDNNVDWSPLYVARMYSWPAFMGMMDRVAVFWGQPPFPTDD
ncbi:hypothetical protein CNY89_00315 [Amaricoccus sp. HAR-UPW-R2A-40]|nr:hypothetical protein CNY89_00315 [Amaricoccus sp. HAR-UPW-R2A-40]